MPPPSNVPTATAPRADASEPGIRPLEAQVISRDPPNDEHATKWDTSGSTLSATLAGLITGLAGPYWARNTETGAPAVNAEEDLPEASAVAKAQIIGRCPIDRADIVEIEPRQPVLCLDAADAICCLLLRQELASACCAPASRCALVLTCCLVCFEGFDRTPYDAALRDQACETIYSQSTKCQLTYGSYQEAWALASCRDGGPLGQYGGRRDRFCCPTYRDGELLGGTPPFNESSAELYEMMGENSGTLQPLGPCCIARTS